MPSIVQHVDYEPGFGAAGPATATLHGTSAGNSIVIIAFELSGSGFAFGLPSDGTNTYSTCLSVALPGASGTCSVWLASNIAGGDVTASSAYTGSPGGVFFYMFEISGAVAFDGGNADGNFGPTPSDAGTFTLTHTNGIVLSACENFAGGAHQSTSSGYTFLENTPGASGGAGSMLQYKNYSSAPGSQSPTSAFDNGGSIVWMMCAAGFYGSAVAPFGGCAYEC